MLATKQAIVALDDVLKPFNPLAEMIVVALSRRLIQQKTTIFLEGQFDRTLL